MDSPSIQARFAAQAARTPDATALSGNGGTLSYRELDERSDELARLLVGSGAGFEVPVVVSMQRSPELVIATLAVLKAGSYYVPLHTASPLRRKQRITDQFVTPLLLMDEATRRDGVPEGCRELRFEAQPEPAAEVALPRTCDPDQLAYVMFTSGTTGEPKGVAVTHRGTLGLALDRAWDSTAYERCLMVSPYVFSMSTFELWVPLLHGGQIVVYPGDEIELTTLDEVIARDGVTAVHLTAGLFRVVADEMPELLAPLREVMTGGDFVSPAAVARVLQTCPDLVVRAMYGATETTLFIANSPITAPYEAAVTVPIGRPMDNKRVYLLDEYLRPVAAGEAGEMYVAGGGLARGYFGRPELTAERFLPDPSSDDGERMYRTGDLARWNSAGLLELLGRADDQVKIRGIRVEPAEVEAILAAHPCVRHAAVIPRAVEPGDLRLVAYVVPTSEVTTGELRDFVAAQLPDYMVPETFSMLSVLPVTANGKLDRAALPGPSLQDTATPPDAPHTATEKLLCTVFAETLDHPSVAVNDDFFELSGQSMQAIRMIARIERATGFRLSIAVLYENPTPRLLAEQVDQGRREIAPASTASAS